jgi:acetyltransferase-like isoleucine patch superfamily enzyme
MFKYIVSFVYKVCIFIQRNIGLKGSTIILSGVNVNNKNILNITYSKIIKTKIKVGGNCNKVCVSRANIYQGNILIRGGNNNTIIIESGVELKDGIIILDGENCLIRIRENTIFNGVRMVNIGKDNVIDIGKNCLFADNIEIWASDTHAIYDDAGEIINSEQPVKVGEHVWVGSHVKILKGVNIGNGAVVGMGSLVTKDVKPRELVAGNPVRTIRENITWTQNYPTGEYINAKNHSLYL